MIRCLLALVLLLSGAAHAHQASEAYISYRIDGAVVTQRLDIALRDLDRDLALDADGDGALSWGEVRQRWPDIEALATAGLSFTADGARCVALDRPPPQLEDHSDGTHAVLVSHWRCPADVRELAIDYRLFAATDAAHRGLVRLVGAAGEPQVLVPGAGVQHLNAQSRGLGGFVIEGKVQVNYEDGTEEVVGAGEVYYWPSGHTIVVKEAVRMVEFSPHDQMSQVLTHVVARL